MVVNSWIDGKVNDLLIGLESGVSVNGTERTLVHNEKAVLKVSAVSYGKFDPLALKVIDDVQELSRAKVNPKAGQIIISRSNTENLVGASAYIEQDYPNLFLPDKLWQTIPKPNTEMKWLSYVLASEHARYTLSKLATGTSGSMKNITQDELLSLKIAIPPLPEQKKIAQILSTWDQAITATEQLLANSQQQKKALMQQLLTGKKRLLDDSGVVFSGEWLYFELKDVAKITMGSSPKSEAYNEFQTGLPLIQGNADIKNRFSYPRIYTTEITKECMPNDILLSVRAPVGNIALSKHNACIGRGIAAIKANKVNFQGFLYQLLLWMEPRWSAFSQGSTFESINSDDIKRLKLKIPAQEEQTKIAIVLSTADQEIEALQKKLEHLKQEKKALMQQLLMGKRRVKVEA